MDTIERLRRAKEGDKHAREQLITENVGLVWSIVRRFLGRGYEAEDLFQIGIIGLIKSIDNFNTSFDVKFSTYAVPMISGEIKRFLRDDSMIKVSRSMKENNYKIKQISEQLCKELGREATLAELAERSSIPMEDIVLALEACTEVESLSKPIYQGDGSEITLAEKIPLKEDKTEQLLNHMVMEQVLATLGDTERRLIEMRYFEEKTQMEVAKCLGISQVQVSRMEKKILLSMRRQIGEGCVFF